VLGHIDVLAKEKEQPNGRGELTSANRRRLAALQVELDQSRNLLRQPRVLHEFGNDAEKAKVRAANVVENYEQQLG